MSVFLYLCVTAHMYVTASVYISVLYLSGVLWVVFVCSTFIQLVCMRLHVRTVRFVLRMYFCVNLYTCECDLCIFLGCVHLCVLYLVGLSIFASTCECLCMLISV